MSANSPSPLPRGSYPNLLEFNFIIRKTISQPKNNYCGHWFWPIVEKDWTGFQIVLTDNKVSFSRISYPTPPRQICLKWPAFLLWHWNSPSMSSRERLTAHSLHCFSQPPPFPNGTIYILHSEFKCLNTRWGFQNSSGMSANSLPPPFPPKRGSYPKVRIQFFDL